MYHSALLRIQSSTVANFLPRPLDKSAQFTEEVRGAGTPLLKTLEICLLCHACQNPFSTASDFGSQEHELHATTRHMRSQLV